MRLLTTNKKCPKCRSKKLYFTELWKGHSIQWEQEDGKIDLDDGALNPGDPFSVYGECRDCRHVWKFRNVQQIHYLIE